MKPVITPEIEMLERDIRGLEERVRVAKAALYSARCLAAGIQEGDLCRDKRGVFKAVSLNFGFREEIWCNGYRQKKDGAFSERSVWIGGGWEKIGGAA